jgi:HPt (histidine-containing phosphotransfer) domain-containing protein
MVHTLKGVAGNMGCNLLHVEAHNYEQAIKESHTVPASHHTFVDALSQTITAINALATETNASPDTSQQREAFITALSQHEFIPEEQLDKWLNELAIPASQHETIRDAIDELDYEIALELVKTHSD